MINKVQKIRKGIEKLKSQLIRGACSSQIAMETRCKEEAYNEVLAILDTVQEEPVSEGLEEASKEWLRQQLDKSYANYGEGKMMELTRFDGYAMLDAIEFGANWQKEQFEKNRLAAYNKAIKDARKWLEGGNIFRYLDYDKEADMVYMTGNLYEDLEKELTITKKVEDLMTK